MSAKKGSSGRILKSDLARVAKHRTARAEYDEIPELTAKDLARSIRHIEGKPRGRPSLEEPKRTVTIRLDAAVLKHFKLAGEGYQGRINEALRKAAGLAKKPSKRRTG